jgi:hypothetical protein
VGVADREPGLLAHSLPVGEVLASRQERAPDSVERVVLVSTASEGGLLDSPADFVEGVPTSLTTWKALCRCPAR